MLMGTGGAIESVCCIGGMVICMLNVEGAGLSIASENIPGDIIPGDMGANPGDIWPLIKLNPVSGAGNSH